MPGRSNRGLVCAVLALVVALCATPASAQLNDQLKAYTGVNAEGYLEPLSSAFGAALNDAFFYSADIPTSGFRITIEFPIMGVIFSDDDRISLHYDIEIFSRCTALDDCLSGFSFNILKPTY